MCDGWDNSIASTGNTPTYDAQTVNTPTVDAPTINTPTEKWGRGAMTTEVKDRGRPRFLYHPVK